MPVGIGAVHRWRLLTVRSVAEGEREMQHDDAVGEDIHEEEANMYREHVVAQVRCQTLPVCRENMRLRELVLHCVAASSARRRRLGTRVSGAPSPTHTASCSR